MQDEEGAIAYVIQMRLKKLGFDLHYVPFNRWEEFRARDGDDGPE